MTPTQPRNGVTDFASAIERLPIAGAWKRFIIPQKLDRIYTAGGPAGEAHNFAREVLSRLNVKHRMSAADISRIPATGPVVVVANHPFGMLEGLILLDLLRRIRPDAKILANSLLAAVPELRDGLILVDPFEGAQSANRRGVRETLSHLAAGGLLIVFPAGEVSHFQISQRNISDPLWNENIVRFIRHSAATVVPVFIKGANSLPFQLMGMIHPHIRTACMLHELVNKEQKTIELRAGTPIAAETLKGFGTDAQITRYLRYRTYLLKDRGPRPAPRFPNLLHPPKPQSVLPIATPVRPSLLTAEIDRLTPVTESGSLAVYDASADEIPNVLREIGRLREVTFRAVGEGTGQPADLDRFDRHYRHIFLWDRAYQQIAGGYRLGVAAHILPRFGVSGLYTSTLFHFKEEFFDRVGPSVELGRSFVTLPYQRQYAPLLLLWKGIGAHVANHPENPVLFGPVSISNDYHPVSRRLIVRYLQAQESMRDLAALVHPRRKFRTRRHSDNEAISLMLQDSDQLSAVTADIEPDGKGIPILLKQYLKLGGKLLGFNVDPHFSNALDGLILVDLRQTDPCVLQRYLGREKCAAFMQYHLARRTPHMRS